MRFNVQLFHTAEIVNRGNKRSTRKKMHKENKLLLTK